MLIFMRYERSSFCGVWMDIKTTDRDHQTIKNNLMARSDLRGENLNYYGTGDAVNVGIAV
jgi:hypothetical protein